MGFLRQLKEVSFSVLPIAVIALAVSLVFGLFDAKETLSFVFSVVMVILGLTLFLMGVDLGLIPVGNHMGSQVMKYKKLSLILITGLFMGTIITLAEPDVQVLAGQVSELRPSVDVGALTFAISLGVGVFLSFAFLRTLMNWNMKLTLAAGVCIIFVVVLFSDDFFISVAFDSGGATTGSMAVPFIMALGLGIANTRKGDESASFGYTGLASLGPVLFVLLYGILFSSSDGGVGSASGDVGAFELFAEVSRDVAISLLPLLAITVLMQIFVMKLPRIKAIRVFSGYVYTYVGLVMFLFSVKYAFMPTAREIGSAVISIGLFPTLVLSTLLGASVVLAEPAIWVLTRQVEEVSQGRVRRIVLLVFMCIGVALAVDIATIRISKGINLLCFLVPAYVLVLLMMTKTPKLFVSIAFDSGGVATGPMSSTFLLPFTLGIASSLGNTEMASFGLIGLIAVMPIISIELLGMIYDSRLRKQEGKR